MILQGLFSVRLLYDTQIVYYTCNILHVAKVQIIPNKYRVFDSLT